MAKPWTSGPIELLHHAVDHIDGGSAFDYRIAFISIDNAIELSIKTYLGLPKRVRGFDGPSRKRLGEASNSFPDLLDLLEEFADFKLSGIDLGDIEWYHRLRNTLYHEGNGVTVDKDKVDSYLQIAKILFQNLFDDELPAKESKPQTVIGEIILASATLERKINDLYRDRYPGDTVKPLTAGRALSKLVADNVISNEIAAKLLDAGRIRNEAAHSAGAVNPEAVKAAADLMRNILASPPFS